MTRRRTGTSGDAMLLTLIKLITIALSFTVTRLLSQFLTKHDYGTYSQILLIVSTVTSVTILGMADGVNYFYCAGQEKKEAYLSTIYFLQCVVSTAAGAIVLFMTVPIGRYFGNPDVCRLLIYAASLPLFQNLLSMTQVLLVSVGKARMLAVRNLIVSILRLGVVVAVVFFVRDVGVILLATLLMDTAQILLFAWILRKNACLIRLRSVNFKLMRTIFGYCAPMAVYTLLHTLSRDCDKYLIGLMTDTQTLAVYSNASKALPFDLIAASFMTVLLPKITRCIAEKKFDTARKLYRAFLEIAYISTAILCGAVLASSPQVVRLLYSEKYLEGLPVFCVYVLVDLLRFTNITLILSAAGRTKMLMRMSLAALFINVVLNAVMFWLFGTIGPALATLVTTLLLGVTMLRRSAGELHTGLSTLFDRRYFSVFVFLSTALTVGLWLVQRFFLSDLMCYWFVLSVVVGAYIGTMGTACAKRFLGAIRQINALSRELE